MCDSGCLLGAMAALTRRFCWEAGTVAAVFNVRGGPLFTKGVIDCPVCGVGERRKMRSGTIQSATASDRGSLRKLMVFGVAASEGFIKDQPNELPENEYSQQIGRGRLVSNSASLRSSYTGYISLGANPHSHGCKAAYSRSSG